MAAERTEERYRDDDGYGIHSKFDIQKHKATFTGYMEVIIDENGTVMYAVPSHQEKAIALAEAKLGKPGRKFLICAPGSFTFTT